MRALVHLDEEEGRRADAAEQSTPPEVRDVGRDGGAAVAAAIAGALFLTPMAAPAASSAPFTTEKPGSTTPVPPTLSPEDGAWLEGDVTVASA